MPRCLAVKPKLFITKQYSFTFINQGSHNNQTKSVGGRCVETAVYAADSPFRALQPAFPVEVFSTQGSQDAPAKTQAT